MPSIKSVQDKVSKLFSISPETLLSSKRKQNVLRARQTAMFLSRELSGNSYPKIGSLFKGRHHTTVMHACQRIEELMKKDPKFRKRVESLQKSLT